MGFLKLVRGHLNTELAPMSLESCTSMSNTDGHPAVHMASKKWVGQVLLRLYIRKNSWVTSENFYF